MTRKLFVTILLVTMAARAAPPPKVVHTRAHAQRTADAQIKSQYALGRHLLDTGHLDKATSILIDLWYKMRTVHWIGVRYSYLLADLHRLAAASPAARERLEQVRAEALHKGQVEDWYYLSKTLGHDRELLQWHPAKPLPRGIRMDYFTFLIKRQRLAKAGSLFKHPAQEARQVLAMRDRLIAYAKNGSKEERAQLSGYARNSARRRLLNLYAACRAAGRQQQARAVRKLATSDDPTLAKDLDRVDKTVKMGNPRSAKAGR